MIVKVVDIGLSRVVSRGRSEREVSEALVGDETGCVLLTLWEKQIERVKVGDTIEITKGYTTIFRGSLRLNIGRYGKVQKVDKEIDLVNTKNNLSEEKHQRTLWYSRERRPFRRRRRR
jgi:replication factor A1